MEAQTNNFTDVRTALQQQLAIKDKAHAGRAIKYLILAFSLYGAYHALSSLTHSANPCPQKVFDDLGRFRKATDVYQTCWDAHHQEADCSLQSRTVNETYMNARESSIVCGVKFPYEN